MRTLDVPNTVQNLLRVVDARFSESTAGGQRLEVKVTARRQGQLHYISWTIWAMQSEFPVVS